MGRLMPLALDGHISFLVCFVIWEPGQGAQES
jgi:hypothetical protein